MGMKKPNRLRSGAGAPQPKIKRPCASMSAVGFLDREYIAAEFRQVQPERHLSSKHAALTGKIAGTCAFSGNHQHELGAVGLTFLHKSKQSGMRLLLRSAVQIDPGVESLRSAGEPLLRPALERHERRRGGHGRRDLADWRRGFRN